MEEIRNQDLTVAHNGTFTHDRGYDGIGQITVIVPTETNEISITENGTYFPTYPKVAFNRVLVNVNQSPVLENRSITSNGTYYPSAGYDGFNTVTITAPIILETRLGLNINNFIGDLDLDGKLSLPHEPANIVATGIIDVADEALEEAFRDNDTIMTVNFPDLVNVSGYSSFTESFYGCGNLTSVNFPSLTSISGTSGLYGAFHSCVNLSTLNFPSLSTIGDSGLRRLCLNCSSLTSISFPALTSNSFGVLTNQFNYMLNLCSNVTVHFPSNLEGVIGSWSDVTSGFGGTNTTVLYDLPATV